MTNHRKCLTRSPPDYEIDFTFILFCIKIPNIREPIIFSYLIICKIAFLAIGFYIASKNYFML